MIEEEALYASEVCKRHTYKHTCGWLCNMCVSPYSTHFEHPMMRLKTFRPDSMRTMLCNLWHRGGGGGGEGSLVSSWVRGIEKREGFYFRFE